MSKVFVTENASSVMVRAPYHPGFPDQAENLGGEWVASKRVWRFDKVHRDAVIELCREYFDNETPESKYVNINLFVKGDEFYKYDEFNIIVNKCKDLSLYCESYRVIKDQKVIFGVVIDRVEKCGFNLLRNEEYVINFNHVPLEIALHIKRMKIDCVRIIDTQSDSSINIGILQNEFDDILSHMASLEEAGYDQAHVAYMEEIERCQWRLDTIKAELDKRMYGFGGQDGRIPLPMGT